MLPAGGQQKQKAMINPFKMAGRASPFKPLRKRFGSSDKIEVPPAAVKEYASVEIDGDGDRDEFEAGRDMYDPDEGESRTLNTLSQSLSMGTEASVEIDGDGDRDEFEAGRDMYDPDEGESRTLNTLSQSLSMGTEIEDDDSLGSGTIETWTSGMEDEESVSSYDAPKETVPPGKVFTKSVMITSLEPGEHGSDSLVLRAQHRDIRPDQKNHVFINVRVSHYIVRRNDMLAIIIIIPLTDLSSFKPFVPRHQAFLHLMW